MSTRGMPDTWLRSRPSSPVALWVAEADGRHLGRVSVDDAIRLIGWVTHENVLNRLIALEHR
jgi:hypothetical protein